MAQDPKALAYELIAELSKPDVKDIDIPHALNLISRGAAPNEVDENYNTPLVYAVTANLSEITRALLRAGADPNTRDEQGIPMLAFTANNGFTDIARALLDAGADPELQDVCGETARQRAYYNDHTEIVQMIDRAVTIKKINAPIKTDPLPPLKLRRPPKGPAA